MRDRRERTARHHPHLLLQYHGTEQYALKSTSPPPADDVVPSLRGDFCLGRLLRRPRGDGRTRRLSAFTGGRDSQLRRAGFLIEDRGDICRRPVMLH